MPDIHSLTPEQSLVLTGVHHPQVPVCIRPEYTIFYERFGEYTFIHVLVHVRWASGVKQRFSRDVQAAFELHGGPVLVFCQDPKQKRFCQQFGFNHECDVLTNQGERAEILVKRS